MPYEDYDLLNLFAETGMSQVWRATDTRNGKQVALKKPLHSTVRAGRRFSREVEAQRAAAGPHTMPILEYDETDGWYVMPWADGTLADRPVPDPSLVLDVLEAIASSLKPLHALGQVHRDLKPENVLWLNGRWVVADFGIVRNPAGATTATLTQHGGVLGSAGWMAPEQHGSAHDATPHTDVYSAGAIVSWLTTGRKPVPTEVFLPDPPSNLKLVVWKASRPRALDRYADTTALLTAAKAAAAPRPLDMKTLVKARNFTDIVAFAVQHPSRYAEVVETLPAFSRPDVRRWYQLDRVGAHTTVNMALDGLRREGIGDLAFSQVDAFLSWALHLLSEELAQKHREAADDTAVAVFGTIAEINQFAPARDVLDWLDKLSSIDQDLMEDALRMSDAWAFFEAQASGRWVSSRSSSLVMRLSGN